MLVMAIMNILNLLPLRIAKQFAQSKILLQLALLFSSFEPSAATASPVVLSCKDNDNLYDVSYTVSINAKLMTISIFRANGIRGAQTDPYLISDIQNDNGVYVVTADGKLLNSHIVVTYSNNATVAYSDAFSNRPIAIDNCISVRSYKNQSR
jgi:hypothetical protein